MNDDRLRDAFAQLRRSDTAAAPRFEQLWRSRMVPPHRRPVGVAFAILLLIAIVTAAVLHRPRQPRPAISAWRAPTDFLLKTPGQELLRSVPDLKGKTQ